MLYAGDAQWWRHYWREIDQTDSEHWTVSDAMRDERNMGWIRGLEADAAQGMSRNPDRIHTGGNSGFAAVNLVALWGADTIVLLGFDMQMTAGRRHAHADHPHTLGNPPTASFPVWRERFAAAAEDLRAMGVTVINASRVTALQAFERRALDDVLDRPPVVIEGMKGLGDNLYQRPFIRELARGHEVVLRTPWPQLYADLQHVTSAPSETTLRTQQRNEEASDAFYVAGMRRLRSIAREHPKLSARRLTYIKAISEGRGMTAGLAESSGCTPSSPMDLPPLPPSIVRMGDRPICVVRPVTVRTEWTNTARNPLPEYVADVARWLRDEGMWIISIADLVPGEEEATAPLPQADQVFHRGELDVLQLLALVANAAAVVGPVGWIVPAAIAAHVPAFIVLGGQGGHNAPERITDETMAVDLIGWGIPDAFCRCTSMRHACAKGNSRLRDQYDEWRLRVDGRRSAAMVA